MVDAEQEASTKAITAFDQSAGTTA